MMACDEVYHHYWGKALREKPEKPSTGSNYHLLPYHCLDVAAVGSVLLEQDEKLKERFAQRLLVSEGEATKLICFFLALHDVGKFSPSFQTLRPDLSFLLQGGAEVTGPPMRHTSLGYILLHNTLVSELFERRSLLSPAGEGITVRMRRWVDQWAQIVTGHHGQPPTLSLDGHESALPLHVAFASQDVTAATDFIRRVAELFLGDMQLKIGKEHVATIRRHSWWLAGFAVLADWLGSDQSRFLYEAERYTLESYWKSLALPRAREAIREAGVLPARPSEEKTLQELCPHIKALTPMQLAVSEIPLAAKPRLFILEDSTGSGKTEAALLLLNRLMAAGMGRGAYIALPTMATANGMYDRVGKAYRKLFERDSEPSLVLAHSARSLVGAFRQSIISTGADKAEESGEDPASAQCQAWIADNPKKALLADMGVGTIDQALLATLYSRFQSLRLMGLLGKVLVVDEVHACDAYMHRLLRTLLTFHSASGGSAILLSATLPAQVKQELAASFLQGLGEEAPSLSETHYPMISSVGHGENDPKLEVAVSPSPGSKRSIDVELVTNAEMAVDILASAASNGRCGCWIRNTVADALEAFELLSERVSKENLLLFHARFAMGDRLEIEKAVTALFGKNGDGKERAGKVVVATQVVEQSLDLDFDVMVSDLAPVDLLVQRAGRLCRHPRDEQGRLVQHGMDSRGKPCLRVLGPFPEANPKNSWYSDAFPKAQKVYPDHGQLWLTAHLLLQEKSIRIPENLRKLIEGVYSQESEREIPQNLLQARYEALAGDQVGTAVALQNSLRLEEGYSRPALSWWDERSTPTRLGEPMTTVRLGTFADGEIRPICKSSTSDPWAMSEVRVRSKVISRESHQGDKELEGAIERAKGRMRDQCKWSILLPLVEEHAGCLMGRAFDDAGREIHLKYDRQKGLVIEHGKDA